MKSFRVGRIELIVGPMFAGKTTEMLRRVSRLELAHQKAIVMKYSRDTRYSENKVSTHDLTMRPAIPCSTLTPHFDECLQYDVVGIDEGQFFPDIVEFSDKLANLGKIVIVCGLDGDFLRKPFGNIVNLISRSESITKLTAVCIETGGDACYSHRIVESKEIELIGGSESYVAASRSAYFNRPITGEIHLTLGPVKSGKTTELARIMKRYKIAGKSCLLIRPKNIVDNTTYSETFSLRVTETLPSIDEISQYQIIGIDDAQNYENLTEFADQLANMNKLVFIAALDSNSNLDPFESVVNLFPMCEYVNKLEAVCPITGLPAHFSVFKELNLIPISRFALLNRKTNSVRVF